MRFPRLPYWLVCSVMVLALLFAALGRQERADAPPPPPPLPPAEGAVLADSAPVDPAVLVKVAPLQSRSPGVGFSVADSGVWVTARRVVDACGHAAILTSAGQGIAANVSLVPTSDLAVLTTQSGTAALPLAPHAPAHGALVFAPGFAAGRPAEAAMQLEGARALAGRGRGARAATVLVLAEIGRTEGLKGPLTSLVGAPALDGEGRVVGVILGEAPRRGRLYAAPPEALAAALAAAKATPAPQADGLMLTPDNYGLAADDLRRALRVAPVVCVSR